MKLLGNIIWLWNFRLMAKKNVFPFVIHKKDVILHSQ
jgi:hypothetical protein